MAQIPFLQGHRGCRGLFPENSLPAFAHALEIGVDVLEMDVCMSADGQVVVSHEPYMNALYASHPSGKAVGKDEEANLNLFHMSYDQIKGFDVGMRGNVLFPDQQKTPAVKPLLSEVLVMAEAFRKKTGRTIYYNIELKSEPAEYGISQPKTVDEFSQKVQQVIASHVDNNFVIIQSFDFNVLAYWHKNYPAVTLSALVSKETPAWMLETLGFVPAIFSPDYRSLEASLVDYCHAKGMRVIPWTVNSTRDMQRMIDMRVDGLISDYPNRFPKPL